MKLPSQQLEAFHTICQTESFSIAARELGVTQSALSQRIKKLEDTLNTILVNRESQPISLTSSGEKLLQYCSVLSKIEEEYISDLSSSQSELKGHMHIGAYSSLMRSTIIPLLSPTIRANPNCFIHFHQPELREAQSSLLRGSSDLVFTNTPITRQGIQSEFVGQEINVLVESKIHKSKPNSYLDHDHHDQTTLDFLKLQKQTSDKIHRSYYDEAYSIIEGVKAGHGRAVIPKHLIKGDKEIKIIKTKNSLRHDVYMNYINKGYFTRLEKEVIGTLRKGVSKRLAG
ncbi:LysR family transcriptional regulator [bacterium]|nr:LysR family transcriptional regulator [bacterium]